jgi:hypothetical protein
MEAPTETGELIAFLCAELQRSDEAWEGALAMVLERQLVRATLFFTSEAECVLCLWLLEPWAYQTCTGGTRAPEALFDIAAEWTRQVLRRELRLIVGCDASGRRGTGLPISAIQ